jgi:hypothetical protein
MRHIMNKNTDSNTAENNGCEILKLDFTSFKNKILEKDIQIEILNLNKNEITQTKNDLVILNLNLKEHISRRKPNDENEIIRLMESLQAVEKEKLQLETKLREIS